MLVSPLPALLIKRSKLFNFLKIHLKCSLYDSVDMFTGDKQSHYDYPPSTFDIFQ